MAKHLEWKVDTTLPVGKGASLQRFTASDGVSSFEIDTTPWAEGDLIVNGVKRMHAENEKNQQAAFQDLKACAEQLEQSDAGITPYESSSRPSSNEE
jgi:hypothetical protein